MATNTKIVQRGTLTVKSGPYFTPTGADIDRLVRVRAASSKAVDAAIEVLEPLSTRPDVSTAMVGELAYKILRFHFKLPPLTAGPLPSVGTPHVTTSDTHTKVSVRIGRAGIEDTAWKGWRADLVTIVQSLKAIQLGLSGALTIADQFSTSISRMDRAFRSKLATDVDAAFPQAPPDLRAMLVDSKAMAARPAFADIAMKQGGSVSPRRAVLGQLMDKDPEKLKKLENNDLSASLTAGEQGSIHFSLQLLAKLSTAHLAIKLVHEASHKFCYTRDFAYVDGAGYLALTKDQSLRNADSYGHAAVSFSKRHCFSSLNDILAPPIGTGINMNV